MRFAGFAVATLFLTACSGRALPPSAKPAPAPTPAPVAHATIPLRINDGDKPGLHVTFSVGGAAMRPFLLDTGSSGFWVYRNAIGSYRATNEAVSNAYSSGIVYDGVVAYTSINYGNGLEARDVPVALVQSATCKSNKPNCPASPSTKHCPGIKPGPDAGVECLEYGRKLYGTFGADVEPIPVPSSGPAKTALYNVLFAIPQPWAASFVVTPQALELGPLSTQGFTTMPLTAASPLPRAIPSGAKPWKRDVTACFTVGTSLKNYCVATLFDTGAASVGFQADVNLPLANTSCGSRVRAGTPFAMRTRSGALLGSFAAGHRANWNVAYREKAHKQPQVNTGLTFFNRDEILYDAASGRVGLRPLVAPGNTATQGCSG